MKRDKYYLDDSIFIKVCISNYTRTTFTNMNSGSLYMWNENGCLFYLFVFSKF